MTTLRIASADVEAIRAHAREGAPLEVCGVLVGRRSEGDIISVDRAIRTANAHATPRVNYLIPPDELLSIVLRAEDGWGLEVVGFYHSHPAGPPHLSKTDHAWASWAGAVYYLQWLAPVEGVGAWRWGEDEKSFEPLFLDVSDRREAE